MNKFRQYQIITFPLKETLPEVITLDKWFVRLSEPRWDKPRWQWLYPFSAFWEGYPRGTATSAPTKNTTAWTKQSKNTTAWTKQSKSTTSWT